MKKRRIIFGVFFIYVCLLTVPYIAHKKVSDTYKNSFRNRTFFGDTPGNARVASINANTDALLYRLNMTEQAKQEIILSTFDFNADDAGKDMMAALLHAADRGVSVRIIVDGFSGFLDIQGDPWFQALTSHPNISLKIYNPVNLLKPWNMQARLHDKYLIIDQSMYLIGGRNTTNLFLGNYSSSQNIDRELFIYETVPSDSSSLVDLRIYFESVWALPDSKEYNQKKSSRKSLEKKVAEKEALLKERYIQLQEQYPAAYEPWDYQALTMEANQVSLLTNPIETENKEPWMWYSLHQLMMQGKEITIYTPYIICGKEMYQDLTELTDRQIPVEIITNDVASGANPWGCTDYLNQKKNIFKTGVKVYEFMGEHSCHTKSVLIDDRMSIAGSYNMDMRSTYQDTELMLAIDSEELNQIIRTETETDKTYSKTAQDDGSYSYDPGYIAKETSIGKRIFYGILRIVVIPIRRFL